MKYHLMHPCLRSLALFVSLAVLAAFVAASPAQAQSRSCPGHQVVQSAAVSLNQAAASGSPQAFAAVLDRHVDVSRLAMFALGPYRSALPTARHGEYVQLTRQFMGRLLAQYAGSFTGGQPQVLGCSSNSGFQYVDTRVSGQRVVWRIRNGRLVDVNVGGVWFAPQMRSSFVSVIRRGNGDPAALLNYLRTGRTFG
jgi:ABC-type transporter MlaC component